MAKVNSVDEVIVEKLWVEIGSFSSAQQNHLTAMIVSVPLLKQTPLLMSLLPKLTPLIFDESLRVYQRVRFPANIFYS